MCNTQCFDCPTFIHKTQKNVAQFPVISNGESRLFLLSLKKTVDSYWKPWDRVKKNLEFTSLQISNFSTGTGIVGMVVVKNKFR